MKPDRANKKPDVWLAAVNRASAALTSTLNLDELLFRILEQLEIVFAYDAANIMLIGANDATRIFRGRGYERFGAKEKLPEIAMQVSAVAGLRQMRETKRPLVIPNVERDPHWVYSIPEHRWIKSYIGIPLISRDEVIGFLNILSHQAGLFAETNTEPLETFAHHAAIAVENARLYQQQQKQNERLEMLVADRTSQLTHAVRQLQEANKELNAYAHMVAHDLQGPLTNILGFVEIIRHKQADLNDAAAIEPELTTIYKSTWQMSRIIANLLLLANARHQEAPLKPVDMSLIVENALLSLAYLMAERQPIIKQPAVWPAALGFEPWVEVIWANYIGNALKYGGNPPEIELGADPPRNGRIRFWTRDNGPGLSPADQARLFTEFTRVGHNRAKGHGLGLSIARQICEKLGGEVGVESSPREGSLFYFTLPACGE